MKLTFTIFLAVHGAIHSMGFLKAFGLAPLPQLALPVSRPLGCFGWARRGSPRGLLLGRPAVARQQWRDVHAPALATRLGGYRAFGPYRPASRGETRYHAAQGEYAYGEFTMENIDYNVGASD